MAPETAPDTSSRPEYNYPSAFQQRILAMMVFDGPNFQLYERTIKPEYFENQVFRDIAEIIVDFYHSYSRPPQPDELLQKIGELLASNPNRPENEYFSEHRQICAIGPGEKFDCARDEVEAFAKYEAMRNALIEGAGILKEEKDYGPIKKLVEKALEVSANGNSLEVISLAERERKSATWFWHNKIPSAKLSLIVGDPGVGKSFFTSFIASAVTTGCTLPPTRHALEQGRVIIISAEDGIDDVIVPRIEDNHGDKSRIDVIRGTREGRLFSLAKDLPKLEALIISKPDLRLIIIDPVSAYFGSSNIDTHRDTDVRSVLDPLAILAEKHGVTIIGVMHLNKSQVLSAIYRVSGSTAFVATARSVWAITREKREEEDKSKRYFTPIKTNLSSGDEPGLVWKINDLGAVVFPDLGAVPPSLETQLAAPAPARPTRVDKAKEFLKRMLKDTPQEAEDMKKLAEVEGISWMTLRRAKDELKIESKKEAGVHAPWFWVLPGVPFPGHISQPPEGQGAQISPT